MGIIIGAGIYVLLGAATSHAGPLVWLAFLITLAEETRDPTRTVPRALLLALGLSTALYVAVAMAAVSVLGADALGARRWSCPGSVEGERLSGSRRH